MNKCVTIVVPVYNAEKYLRKCIDSIINQTYKNIELILINDGSTDDSLSVCKEYQDKNNVVIIDKENFGACSARNEGIKIAKGDYIMFFDADDFLEIDAIESLVSRFDKDIDLVIGKTNKLDLDENVIMVIDSIPDRIMLDSYYDYYAYSPFPCNKIFKTDIIKSNAIWFGNVRIGQDLNFYLKYLLFTNKIASLDKIISNYRYVNTGISKTISFKIMDIIESMNDIKKYYRKFGQFEKYKTILNSVEMLHCKVQLEKSLYFKTREERKIIYLYFKFFINNCLRESAVIPSVEKEIKKSLRRGYKRKTILYSLNRILRGKIYSKIV